MTDGEFLSCDWGTTSFRLRWVSGTTLRVLREIREQAGVRSLHEEAIRVGVETEAARAPFFAAFLRKKLDVLLAKRKGPEQPLPLVISGMASSSVGWHELPYGKSPSPLDGSGLRAKELRWEKPTWVGRTYLISGLATEDDIMRGEETEIIGLMADPGLSALRKNCLLILPGTHSKHVQIKNEFILGWRTFMTGELFDVLGRQSLLRASIDQNTRPAGNLIPDREHAAFREGVLWARENGMAGGLFRVRTRAVLGRRPLAENTWFFSGVLIGAELADLCTGVGKQTVVLAAARGLAKPYALALETIAGESIQWIQLPPEQIEAATIAAHALFLNTAGQRTIPGSKAKSDRER